ncbi:MAG: hypothetical protein ACFFD4_08445 [Candidatus Odinarchaeota archaeon]
MKFVVLGEKNVGKEEIVKKLNAPISEQHGLGLAFTVKKMNIPSVTGKEKEIRQQIWYPTDLKISTLELFLKGSHGALIVFDVTNRKSFDKVTTWAEYLVKYVKRGTFPVLLVGNRIDTRISDNSDHVSQEQGIKMASRISQIINGNDRLVPYVETSLGINEGVTSAEGIFRQLAIAVTDMHPVLDWRKAIEERDKEMDKKND